MEFVSGIRYKNLHSATKSINFVSKSYEDFTGLSITRGSRCFIQTTFRCDAGRIFQSRRNRGTEGRRLLGDSQFVGHDIDKITTSYATGPIKSWTFRRSCVGAGGLFPAWHLTCMPQSQNSLGCFLNEDFREKT